MRPAENDYASYYADYVALVPEDDVISALEQQSSETQRLLSSLDETRASFRYAVGKWSVKEVLGHIADAERVFGYRALTIARGDTNSLPGFDEKSYVQNAGFDAWRVGALAEEYALVRRSNVVMFQNLPADAWQRRGTANNNEITVCAIAYIIVGHERHHLRVLREKYLI